MTEAMLDEYIYWFNVCLFTFVVGAFAWEYREKVKWTLRLILFLFILAPLAIIFYTGVICWEEIDGYFRPSRYKRY